MRPLLTLDRLTEADTFDHAVHEVVQAYDFRAHPYLSWMKAPQTDRDRFRASQLPFRHTVEHFSRSLSAALAKVDTVEERLALAANVTEEHGHGSLAATHKHTFLTYLRALGATEDELAAPIPVHVAIYSEFWLSFCLTHSAEEAAACLGIVEYLYIGISGQIARTITERDWVAPGSQSHYEVHETLDVEHSEDLFALCRAGWSTSQRQRVAKALLYGAQTMWSVYDALLPTE